MIASKARSEAKPSGGGGAGFPRAVIARLAGLLGAAGLACMGGRPGKTVDLTPVEVPERALVRDAHGREWYHRALELGAGASFAHYSRPIDIRRALAVTSYTTRQPDRVAARDLARAAIDRTVSSNEQE